MRRFNGRHNNATHFVLRFKARSQQLPWRTIRKPSASAEQALPKVRCTEPRLAQTGRYSRVHAWGGGPLGGRVTGGRLIGGPPARRHSPSSMTRKPRASATHWFGMVSR